MTLEEAVEYAAEHLPEGFEVRIVIERGYGGVETHPHHYPFRAIFSSDSCSDVRFADLVVRGVEEAIKANEQN